jgi:hypothetical protein
MTALSVGATPYLPGLPHTTLLDTTLTTLRVQERIAEWFMMLGRRQELLVDARVYAKRPSCKP